MKFFIGKYAFWNLDKTFENFSYGDRVTFKCDGTRPQKCYQIKQRNIQTAVEMKAA